MTGGTYRVARAVSQGAPGLTSVPAGEVAAPSRRGVETASGHVIAAAITKLASRELGELPEVGTFAGLAGLGAAARSTGILVGFTRLIDAPRRPR